MNFMVPTFGHMFFFSLLCQQWYKMGFGEARQALKLGVGVNPERRRNRGKKGAD
jgi:hypothetical protein